MELSLETIKSMDYGALKIDLRENEGNKYYVYGFKNNLESWDFETCDLLVVTGDVTLIEMLQKDFTIIDNNSQFCERCFKNKKVVASFYVYNLDPWIPKEVLVQIQNSLLTKKFSWRSVSLLPSNHSVSCLFCKECNIGDNEGEFWRYENNKENYITLQMVIKKEISRYIINHQDEKVLEHYLKENIELIESGMIYINQQVTVGNGAGAIDILAKDIKGRLCVIELKAVFDDKKIVYQAAYYQSEIEDDDVRVITITPGYSPKIAKALKNVKNTELMIYYLNDEGILQIKHHEDLNGGENLEESVDLESKAVS